MIVENQFLHTQDPTANLDGTKVLLVDDDFDTRLLFTFILEDYGAKVVSVASAQEALKVIQQVQPHLLIIDICLPGENGRSLLRKIRSLESEQARTPAIAVTGVYKDCLNDLDASSSEFQLHLTKPIDPEELVAAAILAKGRCA
jgi:CheY-like chemotaxis protein